MYFGGLDIGGTKCTAIIGKAVGDGIVPCRRLQFPTPPGPRAALAQLCASLRLAAQQEGLAPDGLRGIGISCGGPLDSARGRILSPPNLPGWDDVPVSELVQDALGLPCALQNDANACALAEWRYGAGRGCRNLIFLTFGTGLGAGLILDGRLYAGTNDNAGEVGHIRLAPDGPMGYGKAGSFEGFCSGGGLARMARDRAERALAAGRPLSFCPRADALAGLSARTLALAADAGDADACALYRECGEMLGRGLALLVDVLNPERIILGSIFNRAEHLLRESMEHALAREALPHSLSVCRVLPAALGEEIGDYAALSVACHAFG